jgi:DNA ligase-1
MAHEWIHKLNESDSRLHKEAVLGTALGLSKIGDLGAVRLLSLLRACYDPFVTFGVKQVGVTDGITGADNPWEEFSELLVKLSKRQLTGHAARDAIVAISTQFDSVEWNVFCRPIILKDIRAGISEKTINKICKKTEFEIPVFGCQLATDSAGNSKMTGEKRLEMKLDGVRALFMVEFLDTDSGLSREPNVTCYSRNGKVFENFSHICEEVAEHAKILSKKCTVMGHSMHNGFVLDGEVMSNSFNELMKQARRKTDVQSGDSVLYVFDVLPLDDFRRGFWNAQQHKRSSVLEEMRSVFDSTTSIRLLPHIVVDLDTAEGKDQFHRYCKDMVDAGKEGVMIKSQNAPYECRRSDYWLKYKPVYDYDLKVVALEEGTGKNIGKMGALVCEGSEDGKFIRVNVGSGYTDEQRREYWDNKNLVIGQTAIVLADAVTSNQDGNYSLRFPRFKSFRTDK